MQYNIQNASVTVPGQCGYSPVSRVIAGVDAIPGAWPWQVCIFLKMFILADGMELPRTACMKLTLETTFFY